VARHFPSVEIQPARLLQRQNDKSSASGHFGDDGQEFGIGGAAIGIVGVFGDFDVLVALVFAGNLAVDVAEFGGPHATERQLSIEKREKKRNRQ
jgi:hypothetical protein